MVKSTCTRTPADTVEIEIIIEDPGIYAKPFTTSGITELLP